MFWADNPGCSATITTLLDNQNITLADLLDEDEILHECKLQNKKLIEFLERPNIIEELIELIVREPSNDTDPVNCYRHPMLASEIISCGLVGLIENIANDTDLLKKVYSFLDSDPPLNPLLASYFFKTFHALLSKHCGQDWYSFQVVCLHVLNFFKSTDFLAKVLKHLGTSAIMDTLQRVIRVEGDEMKKDILNWLDSQGLIEQLIQIICGLSNTQKVIAESDDNKNDESDANLTDVNDEKLKENENVEPQVTSSSVENDVIVENKIENENKNTDDSTAIRISMGKSTNAAQLICDIIVNSRDPNGDCSNSIANPLSKKCKERSTIELLLTSMFSAPVESQQTAIVNAVQVLLVLLNDVPGCVTYFDSAKASSVDQLEINEIGETIMPFLPKLREIIVKDPPKYQYGYGNSIEKPVGAGRLAVIHLIEVLFHLDNSTISTAIVQNDIVPVLFDMFIEHKWNSFLHAHVESIIKKMCRSTILKDMFGKHLINDCKIIEKIIKAWEDNDVSEKMVKPRHGYMGHLITIANSIHIYLEQKPEFLEDVSDEIKQKWNVLIIYKLETVNDIQNLYLGGYHPSRSNNNTQHQQSSIQMYDTDTVGDSFYNIDDDDIDSPFNEDSGNAEQMFTKMCDFIQSYDPGVDDVLIKLVMKGLSPNQEEAEFDEGILPSNKSIDQKILSLASKLSECEPQNSFDKWLPSNTQTEWDEDNDFGSTDMLTSMTVNSSSAWDPVEECSGDQAGWADFSKLENPLTSDNPNAFDPQFFATFTNTTFDQGLPNESDTLENLLPAHQSNAVDLKNTSCNENESVINVPENEIQKSEEDLKSESTFDIKTLDIPIQVTTDSKDIVSENSSEKLSAVLQEKSEPIVSSVVNDVASVSSHIEEQLSSEITKLCLESITDITQINRDSQNEVDTSTSTTHSDECTTSHNEVEICDRVETVNK